MAIALRKEVQRVRLLDPTDGFKEKELLLETRWDPLTEETSRLFEVKWKDEEVDLGEMFKVGIEGFCPFCPENLERVTPKFPEDLVEGGRLKVGRTVVLPNRLPFDKVAGVVVLGQRHFVPLEELEPELICEGLQAARRFFLRVAETDPSIRFFSVNWNFLPTAGGSIVHPHLHAVAGEHPTNRLRRLLQRSSAYWRSHGRSFWMDLLDEERARGERYLGETKGLHWLCSFAPMGYGDVMTIFPEVESILEVTDEELEAFSRGLGALFRFYTDSGFYSFNLALYGGARDTEGFWVHARTVVRRVLPPAGTSDINCLQMLHVEPVVYIFPEELSRKVKPYFEALR